MSKDILFVVVESSLIVVFVCLNIVKQLLDPRRNP